MPNDCKINGICIALILNPCKFNGICTAVMPHDCKNHTICIAMMPHYWKINSICIALMLSPCICNAIALSACWLGGGGWLSKTEQMWLQTPVAQGPAQGSGCPGQARRHCGQIPAAGSPWLLTD